MRSFVLLALALVLAGCASPDGAPTPPSSTAGAASPYVDYDGRPIKALSPEQIADLRAGKGMGFALAAELNSYPGPLHVLELADALELTEEQRAQTRQLRQSVLDKVVPLGEQIVAAEAELDRMFAQKDIDSASLESQLALIAELTGQLRFAHLDAHLAMRALLTAHQVTRYDELRGYDAEQAHVEGHDAHGG